MRRSPRDPRAAAVRSLLALLLAALPVLLVAPPAVAAPQLQLSTTGPLTDGQQLTITGSGFQPGLQGIAVGQCREGYAGPADCNLAGGATFRNADAQGAFTATIVVAGAFADIDCSEEPCVIGAAPLPSAGLPPDVIAANSVAVPIAFVGGEPTPTPSATTPTPTPTTTSATPTPTPTADPGKPATGSVTLACTLDPLGTAFDYPATLTVSGSRATAGSGEVSLRAELSQLPGIAPLDIDGQMDVTLGLSAGGTDVTLAGAAAVRAAPRAPVPVPPLTGTISSTATDIPVGVKTFSFDFAALGVGASCTAPAGATLSTLTVGIGVSTTTTAATPSASTTSAAALPKTGQRDGLPVMSLWASGLLLLGAGVLACVPGTRSRSRGAHAGG